ncbi:uncharacterized protein V1516DRAFT_676240 [Lipomyces oligophaga]|uniref:uncharacterized protein n=1 Tax=Lipomyces oligophaga TaxID=45792 RepID=UPI0034D01A62
MDFSALLSKEIAKKKAAAASIGGGTKQGSTSEHRQDSNPLSEQHEQVPKYIRRADIEASRRQAYEEEQIRILESKRLESERKRKEREEEEQRREKRRLEAEEKYQARKRAREEEEEKKEQERRNKYRKHKSSMPQQQDMDLKKLENLSDDQIVHRLQRIQQPERLADESDIERIKRLLKYEKQALDRGMYRDEILESVNVMIDAEDIKADKDKVYLQMEKYVLYILHEWQRCLVTRESTPEQAFTTLDQTKAYLQPLLSKLRHKDLSNDIYPFLSTLFYSLQQKRYRDANDNYLKLSIGNAAWPIGVTAVGIHERSARERITGQPGSDGSGTGAAQIAHVMSDDKTRKWLNAVKRLITFVEGQWPE